MTDITMPQLGETVTEGTITKWHKAVGDAVKEDEVLYEVSTDKVDTEVTAPTSGFLTEILVPEGDTVDVGTKLAVIGADAPSGGAAAAGGRAGARRAEAEPPAAPNPAEEAPAAEAPAAAEPAPEPAEPALAAEAPAASPKPAPSADDGGGKLLSPVVRRLIAEHGLDPDRDHRHRRRRPHHPRRRPEGHGVRRHPGRPGGRGRIRPGPGVRPGRGPGGRGDVPARPGRDRGQAGRARHRHPAHEHPEAHRRAHGAVEGDLGPRLRVDRGRLRGRRAGPPVEQGRVAGQRGLRPHLPAVHQPGRDRRHRRVPGGQRQLRRVRADRPPLRRSRHRRRPGLQGPDGAGGAGRRQQAAAGHRPRDQRPGGQDPEQEALARRDLRRHVHDHQPRARSAPR